MAHAEPTQIQRVAATLNARAAGYLGTDRAKDVELRARLGGTLVGAGVGAGVGLLGGMLLPSSISKRKRLAGGALVGAGIGGLAGGSSMVTDVFRSNDMNNVLMGLGVPPASLNVNNVGTADGAKQLAAAIGGQESIVKFEQRMNRLLSLLNPVVGIATSRT